MPDIRQERKKKMREELLKIIEKNSRIDLKELAVILGVEEIDVETKWQRWKQRALSAAIIH